MEFLKLEDIGQEVYLAQDNGRIVLLPQRKEGDNPRYIREDVLREAIRQEKRNTEKWFIKYRKVTRILQETEEELKKLRKGKK